MWKQYAMVMLWTGVLAACASSGETATRYYQLPDSAIRAPVQGGEVALQMKLAEPLTSDGLLYQTDDYHVHFAQKNVWSMPLADALAASLANKLNAFSGSHRYLPQALARENAPVLMVYVDRFQGTYRGETEISGFAQWADGRRMPFTVHTPQHGDGYDAMVESLNQGVAEVARQIVR